MPRKKQTSSTTLTGNKRKNPSTCKPKAKKRKLDSNADTGSNSSKRKVLSGKKICITGSFKLKQQEMVDLITENGGQRDASCSKKCDYLVMRNNTHSSQTNSNKCQKAKTNGVPIVKEQFLYDCIEQSELLDLYGSDKNGKAYIIFWNEKRKLPKYPKQIDINQHHKVIDNDNHDLLHKLLCNTVTRDFAMIIYFRALDRYPGGNADIFILKYTLLVNGNHVYLDKITRSNWDGMNYISGKPFQPKLPDDASSRVQQIAESFVRSFGVHKTQDICTEIVDNRYDSEHDDTEWSHLDFRVYIAPKYAHNELEANKAEESHSNSDNSTRKKNAKMRRSKNESKSVSNERRYKSDECEAWKKCSSSTYGDEWLMDVVDDYVGDYDVEKNWLQTLCFRRNALYCSGYGPSRKVPTPKVSVSKEDETLIQHVSALCGVIRPVNESPWNDEIEESRSSKDNKQFEHAVELDMGKTDCYDVRALLLKGYDY